MDTRKYKKPASEDLEYCRRVYQESQEEHKKEIESAPNPFDIIIEEMKPDITISQKDAAIYFLVVYYPPRFGFIDKNQAEEISDKIIRFRNKNERFSETYERIRKEGLI